MGKKTSYTPNKISINGDEICYNKFSFHREIYREKEKERETERMRERESEREREVNITL